MRVKNFHLEHIRTWVKHIRERFFPSPGSREVSASEKAAEYVHPIEAIFLRFFDDLADVFSKKGTRFLNASILLFTAFLPYHLVPIPVPYIGVVRPTETLFIVISIAFVVAVIRGHIRIRKAYTLYVLLFLHLLAQLISVVFAPHGIHDYGPAVSAATYSIFLVILINAVRSDVLVRLALQVMGFSVFGVVLHSMYLYVLQDGVFQTRSQPSVIGNDIGNYLAYLLVMFGAGTMYLFFRFRETAKRDALSRLSTLFLYLNIAAWMYVVLLTGVKIAHICMMGFLVMLVVVLRGKRLWALSFCLLFAGLFVMQFYSGIVQTKANEAYVLATSRASQAQTYIVEYGDEFGGKVLASLSRFGREEEAAVTGIALVSSISEEPSLEVVEVEPVIEAEPEVESELVEEFVEDTELVEELELAEGVEPDVEPVEESDVDVEPIEVPEPKLEPIEETDVIVSDDTMYGEWNQLASASRESIEVEKSVEDSEIIPVGIEEVSGPDDPVAPEEVSEVVTGIEDIDILAQAYSVALAEAQEQARLLAASSLADASENGATSPALDPAGGLRSRWDDAIYFLSDINVRDVLGVFSKGADYQFTSVDNFRMRWTGGVSSSFELRVRGMLAAVFMGADYPFSGVGAGEQMYFFDRYSDSVREMAYEDAPSWIPREIWITLFTQKRWTLSQTNPNNILLMAWAETGTLGLIAITGIFLLVFWRGMHALWVTRKETTVSALRIIVPSFLMLALFQLVNPFILHPWLWTTFAFAYVATQDIPKQFSVA